MKSKKDYLPTLSQKKIKLFNYGSMYSNTPHTQLRLDRSQLNENLFSIGLTNIKGYICEHSTESTEDFLLNCFLYSYERNNILSNLTGVLEKQPATMTKENLLKTLLMGERNDDPLKYKHNKKIFKYVQHFIIKARTINQYYN